MDWKFYYIALYIYIKLHKYIYKIHLFIPVNYYIFICACKYNVLWHDANIILSTISGAKLRVTYKYGRQVRRGALSGHETIQ